MLFYLEKQYEFGVLERHVVAQWNFVKAGGHSTRNFENSLHKRCTNKAHTLARSVEGRHLSGFKGVDME